MFSTVMMKKSKELPRFVCPRTDSAKITPIYVQPTPQPAENILRVKPAQSYLGTIRHGVLYIRYSRFPQLVLQEATSVTNLSTYLSCLFISLGMDLVTRINPFGQLFCKRIAV